MSNVYGKLHNLCQKIPASIDGLTSETWHAYSHHHVAISPSNTRSQSNTSQTSQRASVSPQKLRKTFPPTMKSWTLYMCQTVEIIADKDLIRKDRKDESSEDSETESESEGEDGLRPTMDAWYKASFDSDSALALSRSFGEESWTTFELRLRVAWDSGCLDVLAAENERKADGSYNHVRLSFDSKEDTSNTADGAEEARIEIDLKRLSDKDALRAASMVSTELAHSFNHLKEQTESLKQERDSHRKLLQNNRRHERFREANSSLVNPGRLKRKTVDDEGFEGDDDEI